MFDDDFALYHSVTLQHDLNTSYSFMVQMNLNLFKFEALCIVFQISVLHHYSSTLMVTL